jgi:16S rRNA (cytosine967-C5)-methyltransferase
MADKIDMTAVELDPVRMQKVQQNLDRLDLHAHLVTGDASSAKSWWDGQLFDRILVDAPCSASGVIRRHPDIKSLRQPDDLASLKAIQQQILLQAWSMLRPGGALLYVTCSVLRQENEQQIEHLITTINDVEVADIGDDWGIACRYGRQLLPGDQDGDGFYFALLKKPQKPH